MDKLDFLGAEAPDGEVAPEAQEPSKEPVAEETAEQKESRARDEHGRFKAKEEAAAPVAPTPEAAPPPAPEPSAEQPMVPLAALHETRDKVRDLEARLAALQPKPQAQAPIGPAPDVFADPEGYQSWQNQQLVNMQLNLSEEMARDKYGDELVDAAKTWTTEQFQTRPGFAQEVLSQRNPYAYAVKEYQKQQSLSQLGSDEEIQAYLAWKQAQSAQPAATPQPPQERPPKSIANAPSAGGLQHIAVGPGVAFDDTIK